MKLDINKHRDLFEKLVEEFKKRYGFREVKVPKPLCIDRDDDGSTTMTKLRINKETGKLEYWHEYWDYGWRDENTPGYNNGFREGYWFPVLCQVLGCMKISSVIYFLPNGDEIYRLEQEQEVGTEVSE